MDREERILLTDEVADPEVLDDHTVHAERLQPREGFAQTGHLLFTNDGIEGDVDRPAPVGGEPADAEELLPAEVLRGGARGELLQSEVDAIGARLECVESGEEAPAGREELGPLQRCSPEIAVTVTLSSPAGSFTSAASPLLFPTRARARGEIQLTQPRDGSLSSTPTIL